MGPQTLMANVVIMDGMAWLPKSLLGEARVQALRKELTAGLKQGMKGEIVEVEAFVENDFWFGLPRAYYEHTSTGKLPVVYEVCDAPIDTLSTTIDPKNEMQTDAVNTLCERLQRYPATQAMLQAGTGAGKTVMSLLIAGRLKQRTMILVHMESLYLQWQERIKTTVGGGLPGVFPDAKLGLFRGTTEDYEDCDICIGMIQTLVNRPPDHPVFKHFGLIIVDECHRTGSQTWNVVASRFNAAKRLAVTATPRRKDGGECLFHWHLGEIAWVGKLPLLSAKVFPVKTSFTLTGDYPKWIEESLMVKSEPRNMLIVREIMKAVSKDRKLLVVFKRIEHANMIKRLLDRMLPDYTVGLAVGSWFVDEDDAYSYTVDGRAYQAQFKKNGRYDIDQMNPAKHQGVVSGKSGIKKVKPKTRQVSAEQFKAACECNILLATERKVSEGFDLPRLDTLFITTPTWDIEQVAGRVLRPHKEKRPPVVTHFVDAEVPKYRRAWEACKIIYEDIGSEIL